MTWDFGQPALVNGIMYAGHVDADVPTEETLKEFTVSHSASGTAGSWTVHFSTAAGEKTVAPQPFTFDAKLAQYWKIHKLKSFDASGNCEYVDPLG